MEHIKDVIQFDARQKNKKLTLLENSLMAFSAITSIPVTLYSDEGNAVWECGHDFKVCHASSNYGRKESSCTGYLNSAMNISESLGDVYFFTCSSGLINMCYAINMDERTVGYLVAGPMMMGNNRDRVMASFTRKATDEGTDFGKLLPIISELRLFTPIEINHASILFLNSITAPLDINPHAEANYQKNQEQSIISQLLLQKKKAHHDLSYPNDSEAELINTIRTGDEKECLSAFTRYMEEIILFEEGNFQIIKIRLIALITQLMRINDTLQSNYGNMMLLDEINRSETIAAMTSTGKKLVLSLARDFSQLSYSGNSEIIKSAVSIINKDYGNNITITSIANNIHVNSTYLSALFKKELGVSAVNYIRDVRLAHAEEMLAENTLPISDISQECGFASQSYFTKVFREKHGITPKAYRSQR